MLVRQARSTNNVNWKAEIETAMSELRDHGHEMSLYENNLISREIKKRQEELIPIVGAQVIGEYHDAIKIFQAAEDKTKAEHKAEINRFDSGKFNSEIQAIQARVKMNIDNPANPARLQDKPVSARLAEIYNEAMESGDIHKQRAAVEVIKTIQPVGDQTEKMRINLLTKQAEAEEEKVRQTEGTQKAAEEYYAAVTELNARRENLNKVSEVLGLGSVYDVFNMGPFAKAYKQVQQDPDTGEIKVYNQDAPEIMNSLNWGSKLRE